VSISSRKDLEGQLTTILSSNIKIKVVSIVVAKIHLSVFLKTTYRMSLSVECCGTFSDCSVVTHVLLRVK